MNRISEKAALARALRLPKPAARVLLGIVGKPGVGKSTFSEKLLQVFPTGSCAIFAMDGFHMSNEKLINLGRRGRKGAPDTFEIEEFAATLKRVKYEIKEEVRFPIFNREIEGSIPNFGKIPATASVIIVEGNYLLHGEGGWEAIAPLLDETWFLELDDEVRLARLISRHIEFGKSPEEAESWSRGTDELNAQVIEHSARYATFVVSIS